MSLKVPDYLEPTVQETLNADNEAAHMVVHLLPASMLGAILSKDGNQWCVLLGNDPQSGLVGFGDTPYAAYYAFWKAFNGEKINV